jgi:transcriptional regulator with XRE-family HTH domain
LEVRVKTIRQLREEHGWTQLELANKLSVTPSAVYNWERGKSEPKVKQMRALALVFGVSMDDIAIHDADLQELKIAA